VKASVPPTSSVAIWRGDSPADPAQVLWVRSPQCEGNRHFFAAIKDLPPEQRSPTMAIDPVDPHTLKVTLTATSYVYGARLLCPHAATRYSDNFLDLCAGESRPIIVSNLVIPLMPEDVTLHYGISAGRAS
jgi:hypothetical protein